VYSHLHCFGASTAGSIASGEQIGFISDLKGMFCWEGVSISFTGYHRILCIDANMTLIKSVLFLN